MPEEIDTDEESRKIVLSLIDELKQVKDELALLRGAITLNTAHVKYLAEQVEKVKE